VAVVGVTMAYGDQSGPFPPRFGGFHFSRLDVRDAPMPLDIEALPTSPLGPLTVRDSRFSGMASARSRLRNAPAVSFDRVSINGSAAVPAQ
jgi:hypothetical protein